MSSTSQWSHCGITELPCGGGVTHLKSISSLLKWRSMTPVGLGLQRVWRPSVSSYEPNSCLRTRSMSTKGNIDAECTGTRNPAGRSSPQNIPATPCAVQAFVFPTSGNTFQPADPQIGINQFSHLTVTLTPSNPIIP